MGLEKRSGQSSVFVVSTLMEYGGVPQSATLESLLKEAIHVISYGYEDKTVWELRNVEIWIDVSLSGLHEQYASVREIQWGTFRKYLGDRRSSVSWNYNYISVGASGALFGLLGSMLSELLMNWTIYSNKAVAIITLLFIIALNLAIGILPHVDNFAHIGGFATDFLLGFVLLARPQFSWMESHELPHMGKEE
eukprot:XP_020397315.1 RHOMBOID-like protein 1 [Zea mays]